MTTNDGGIHRHAFFAALALATMSLASFALLDWRAPRRGASAPMPPRLADAGYVPSVAEPTPFDAATWNPPAAQSRGREWVYDTFTPPEIFYDARARQFSVRPPEAFVEKAPQPFGLELITVRPEPFPLQLIGYVGDDGHWRGMFENAFTGEVLLAAAGRRLPELGLTVTSLEVTVQPVSIADSMTTRQRVATAVVRDERSGRELALSHRERKFTGRLTAVVLAAGETVPREVRAGDEFRAGGAIYRVERVEGSPPAADVLKQVPGISPERRTLTSREAGNVGRVAGAGS
jgi:hypothetical protein